MYPAREFINETGMCAIQIPKSYPKQFQAWICDVPAEEIQLGEKINRVGTFIEDISETKSGLSFRNLLTESGNFSVIGGKDINQYGLVGNRGFVDQDSVDIKSDRIQFLLQPKVISQDIIAHIQNPEPHIKITSTVDKVGDLLTLDTVTNTVLTDANFQPAFISALFNSKLISWYAYRFIYCSAIRTMHFSNPYVRKIPVPLVTAGQQQPIVELAEQIMEERRENPNADISTKAQEIDALVYNLYKLTKTEKEIVKASIGKEKKS